MYGFADTPCIKRNTLFKAFFIVPFAVLGIFCSGWSIWSPQWFNYDMSDPSFDSWDVIHDRNNTAHFGLFQYETKNSEGDFQSHPYDPIFAQDWNGPFFASQITFLVPPTFAIAALVFALADVNKLPIVISFSVASFCQLVAVIMAMTWTTDFPSPWHHGSLLSLVALVLYFVVAVGSCLVILPKEPLKDKDSESESEYEESEESALSFTLDIESSQGLEMEEEESMQTETMPASVDGRETAEELLGTKNPIIYRAVFNSTTVPRDLYLTHKREKERAQEAQEVQGDIEGQNYNK